MHPCSLDRTCRSFCNCGVPPQADYEITMMCKCGEELDVHEWAWDANSVTSATRLTTENREVRFHPGFSSGTAAVRGNMPCIAGHDYYWEIKMLTHLYGTDVMVGVGTSKVDLHRNALEFCSMLGSDEESWGYSYTGLLHHNGKKEPYGPAFGYGSIIGVHLDMWNGTLQFYLNRRPLGVAFTSLKGRVLYPMVCSTAAKSAMRVTYSFSCPSSLQLLCLGALSTEMALLQKMSAIPGLRKQTRNAYWWLIPPSEDRDSANSDDDNSSMIDMVICDDDRDVDTSDYEVSSNSSDHSLSGTLEDSSMTMFYSFELRDYGF